MNRTRTLALITTSLLLLLAVPAAAKEITAARVCGSDGCTTIRDRSMLAALPEGGDPTDPPAGAAPFYKMTFTIRAEDATDKFTVDVVPSRNLMRGAEGAWMPMGGAAARLFREIAARHEPFPAAELRGVGRAGKPAPAPDGLDWPVIAVLTAAGLGLLAGAALLVRRAPHRAEG